MKESSIKIQLDIVDKAAAKALENFTERGDRATKSTKKLGDTAKNTFDEISVSIGKSIGVYEIFAGNIAANVVTKAFELAFDSAKALFDLFVTQGIQGASQQQQAIQILNNSLAQTGIYSKEASDSIVSYAEELQALTGVEDDVIVRNASLIQSIARLDEQGLKQATAAALDLQAAMAGKGLSLEAASEALAKAANGNTTALQKMGIEIKKGSDDAQTFANALAAVESRFGGSAANNVRTFSGSVELLNMTFGDFQETLGDTIVQNTTFTSAMNETSKILREFTMSTKESGSGLSQTLAREFIGIIEITNQCVVAFDALMRVVSATWRTIEFTIVGAANGMIQALNKLFLVTDEVAEAQAEKFAGVADSLKNVFSETTGLEEISVALFRIKEASEAGFDAFASGATTAVDPINNTTSAVQKLSEETEKSQERLRSFAEDLIKQGEDIDAINSERIERSRANSEIEQEILKNQLDNGLISYYDYQLQRDEIDAEFAESRMAIEEETRMADMDRLQQARNQDLITQAQFNQAKNQLDLNYAQQKAKFDADQQKKTIKNNQDQLKLEREYGQAKIQLVGTMFGAIGDIAALGGEKNFKIVKAFNLAEAITSGILSIQKAAASAPPPFNIPPIAIATVRAAANVAQIAATRPSFATGGVVGGFGGATVGGDNTTANVRTGEMILNAQQQRNLFDMANIGNNNGNVEALLGRLLVAVETQPVVVQIGSLPVFEAVRTELANGRELR